MSYDVSLVLFDAKGSEFEVFEASYTYNIQPMLAKAGMQSLAELDDMTGDEAAGALEGVLYELGVACNEYRATVPSSGWSSYYGFVAWLSVLQDKCERWPDAELRVS